MKKFLLLIAVVVLAFALASCGEAEVCEDCELVLDECVCDEEDLVLMFGGDIVQPYNLTPGDTVVFGMWQWVVANVEGDRALLIGDGLFPVDIVRPAFREITRVPTSFHNAHGPVTWENSHMRSFLNDAFHDTLFVQWMAVGGQVMEAEPNWRDWVVETEVVNNAHPAHGTPGGGNTRDRVFLLSADEFRRYSQFINLEEDDGWFWLRSPGNQPNFAATVRDGEIVYVTAHTGFEDGGGLLPAVWITMAS